MRESESVMAGERQGERQGVGEGGVAGRQGEGKRILAGSPVTKGPV